MKMNRYLRLKKWTFSIMRADDMMQEMLRKHFSVDLCTGWMRVKLGRDSYQDTRLQEWKRRSAGQAFRKRQKNLLSKCESGIYCQVMSGVTWNLLIHRVTAGRGDTVVTCSSYRCLCHPWCTSVCVGTCAVSHKADRSERQTSVRSVCTCRPWKVQSNLNQVYSFKPSPEQRFEGRRNGYR